MDEWVSKQIQAISRVIKPNWCFADVDRTMDMTCYENFMKDITSNGKTYNTKILHTSGGKAFSYIAIH